MAHRIQPTVDNDRWTFVDFVSVMKYNTLNSSKYRKIAKGILMKILGVSSYHHDSAAASLHNGLIQGASHEERFTRKKFDKSFPKALLVGCAII